MTLFHLLSEDFLHYVWRTLSFDTQDLRTTDGLPVQIVRRGIWNRDQGPDFLEAQVRIGDMLWSGAVEMHLATGGWYRHHHEQDPGYNHTILHVVLDSDGQPVLRQDGTAIPELALAGQLSPGLVATYNRLRLSEQAIPCAPLVAQVSALHRDPWVARLAIERMEQKAHAMWERLDRQVQDWEQVLWEELLAMIGGPVNQETLRSLAHRLPYRVLRRVTDAVRGAEALLFGAAGLLDGLPPGDAYAAELRQEWDFLRARHDLVTGDPLPLRYMRMRPAAFPTIRLAQAAQVICCFPRLADLLLPEQWPVFLTTPLAASAYWNEHYRFGEPVAASPKRLGRSQKEILLINAILPLSYLYHRAHGRSDPGELFERGLVAWQAEDNRHTRPLTDLGFANDHALHSQGLIQLHKHYCLPRRCLDCQIGHQVLKRNR
ncbi:MAG: DUF2851 family protein [Bacteroidia bacterium]